MKKVKLILVIIWMIVIFLLSNQNGADSSKLSNGLVDKTIVKVYEVFKGEISTLKKKEIINKYSYPVRKIAHFTEYFILGILVYIYLIEYNLDKRTIIYTILICFIYAITDEVHQLFVESRGANIIDTLIDTLGSITSSFILNKKVK